MFGRSDFSLRAKVKCNVSNSQINSAYSKHKEKNNLQKVDIMIDHNKRFRKKKKHKDGITKNPR